MGSSSPPLPRAARQKLTPTREGDVVTAYHDPARSPRRRRHGGSGGGVQRGHPRGGGLREEGGGGDRKGGRKGGEECLVRAGREVAPGGRGLKGEGGQERGR